jgi:glycosyltransferase involved in cell wall biosynthesis
MASPKVTVLMPVWNCEPWVAEAAGSILRQDLRDLELLVVDDGSTDRSVEILEGLRDPRVRIHRHASNQGIIATLNEGLELARGEYVARMDGDDVSLPGRLSRQAAYLDAHPHVAVLGGEVVNMGTDTHTWRVPCDPAGVRARLLFSNPIAHAAVMLRPAALRAAGLRYDSAYPHAEDYALWVAVAERAGAAIANVPEKVLNFRMHPGSISHVKRDAQRATVRRIRAEQLRRLGLAPTEADLDLHDALAEAVSPGTAEFLARADAWLLGLREAGRSLGPEVSAALAAETGWRWGRICRRSRRLGLEAVRRFRASPLHRDAPALTRAEVLLGGIAGALHLGRRAPRA